MDDCNRSGVLDRTILNGVCKQVYRRYPSLQGSTPQVQRRMDGNFLVIFRGKARTADGRTLTSTIRAVVSPLGILMKVTSSKS